MKKKTTLLFIALLICLGAFGQFNPTAQNWDVPDVEDLPGDVDQLATANYGLSDFDGDGRPDLIDMEDNASQVVWLNGSQKYWKVYFNTGSGFNPTPMTWNVPNAEDQPGDMDQLATANYGLADFNGDGKPDLIDMEDNATQVVWLNGAQKYWKVYLNTGTGFDPTPMTWNVPDAEDQPGDMDQLATANYGLSDFNGDGKPDLIDMEDNATQVVWLNGAQKYWKVYLNTGTGFDPTPLTWNVPNAEDQPGDMDQLATANYALADFDGDGKPDLIDTEDNASQVVWLNGAQKYWKVYLNTGSGFTPNAQNWNIPDVEDNPGDADQLATANYGLSDFNGDGEPDLIDMEDNASQVVWLNGAQKYWKVYINTGSGFNPTPETWDIPNVEDLPGDTDQLATANYGMSDFDGDGKPDLIDMEDNASQVVWLNGAQKYWKVYLNTNPTVSIQDQHLQTEKLLLWPNPNQGVFKVDLSDLQFPTVRIYNQLGIRVHESKRVSNSESIFDLGTYPAGIYYLRAVDGSQVYEARIIKQ